MPFSSPSSMVTIISISMVTIIVISVFRVPLYYIIFWFIAITNNYLVMTASVWRISCSKYISVQVWSWLIDNYFIARV